jgi:hypothetical protein
MPMPRPKPKEDQQAFVSRFMADQAMRREYPDEKQRAAVAHSEWRRRRREKRDKVVAKLEECLRRADQLTQEVRKLRDAEPEPEMTATDGGELMYCELTKVEDRDDFTFVYGPVLVPDVEDKQGDVIAAEEIEASAHNYLEDSGQPGLQHRLMLGNRDVKVVESHVLRQPMKAGKGESLPVGTWMLGMRVYADKIRKLILSGKLKGYSIGGQGVRIEEE